MYIICSSAAVAVGAGADGATARATTAPYDFYYYFFFFFFTFFNFLIFCFNVLWRTLWLCVNVCVFFIFIHSLSVRLFVSFVLFSVYYIDSISITFYFFLSFFRSFSITTTHCWSINFVRSYQDNCICMWTIRRVQEVNETTYILIHTCEKSSESEKENQQLQQNK